MKHVLNQIETLSLNDQKILKTYFKQDNITKLGETLLKLESRLKGNMDRQIEDVDEDEELLPFNEDEEQFNELLLNPYFDPNDGFFQNYLASYPNEIMNFLNLYIDEHKDEYILPQNQPIFLNLFIEFIRNQDIVISDDVLFSIIDFFTNLQDYNDLYEYNEFIPVLIKKLQDVNVYPEYIETISLLEPSFSIRILNLLMSKNFNINNKIQGTSLIETLITFLKTSNTEIFSNIYEFTTRFIQYPNLDTQNNNVINLITNVVQYHVNIYTRSERMVIYSKIDKLNNLKNKLNLYGYNISVEQQETFRNVFRPYSLKKARITKNTVFYNTLLQQGRTRHIQNASPEAVQSIPTIAQDCTNTQDLFSLEDWSVENLPNIKVKIYKNKDLQGYTTFCGDRDSLLQYFNSQSLIVPWLQKNLNIPIEVAGHGGAPSKDIDPQMNFKSLPNQIYIQNWQLLQDQEYTDFIAIPLEKILVGNAEGTIGISQLHGQADSKQLIYFLVPASIGVDVNDFIRDYLNKLLQERTVNIANMSELEKIRYIYLYHPYKSSDYDNMGKLVE